MGSCFASPVAKDSLIDPSYQKDFVRAPGYPTLRSDDDIQEHNETIIGDIALVPNLISEIDIEDKEPNPKYDESRNSNDKQGGHVC